MNPTIEDQIRLEEEMVQAGADRYIKQKDEMMNKGMESKTKHGRAIIASVVDPVANRIREAQKESIRNNIALRKLQDANPEQTAFISLVAVIDGSSAQFTLHRVAKNVGNFVEDNMRLNLWHSMNKEEADRILDYYKDDYKERYKQMRAINYKLNKDGFDEIMPPWTTEERVRVGMFLIDFIIVETGIIRINTHFVARNKSQSFVEATEKTLEWIKNFNNTAMMLRPRYVPSIVPPKEWTDVFEGGYHSDFLNKLPMVRAH
jgi:DNA-directed RNA polymerase